MAIARTSTLISLCVATALAGAGCGRDGLLSNETERAVTPGDAARGSVTIRRTFRIPNNFPGQWAAYQDGAGPWIPIKPIVAGGQEYEFVVKDPSQRLGFVVAADLGFEGELPDAKGPTPVEVSFTFLTVDDCLKGLELGTSGPSNTARTQHGTISWSVVGVAADEQATVSIAGRSFYALQGSSSYSVDGDWPMSADLLATVGPSDGLPTRMIVRRNLHLAPGLTIPTIDLSSGESFLLQAGHITLTDTPNADWIWGAVFLTTAASGNTLMNQNVVSGATVPFMFLPSSQQVPSDLYQAVYGYQSAAGTVRVTDWFHSPTGHQMVIPAIPSGARVWNSGGSGDVRLTAEWPTTEPGWIRYAYYTQGPDAMYRKLWSITVTPSYDGGNGGAMTVPDLRNVDGWKSLWDLDAGTPTSWSVGSVSSASGNPALQDGASEISAAQLGTITP